MKKAILFLFFNRPATAQKVFEQIKTAKPPRIYLASDGARASKDGEMEIVESLRQWVLDNIDWECEVKTLFRQENLGCGRAVSSAITWFFENEPEGIILEDDCLPNQSFFTFCEELLDYYKEDKRIWHISGDNLAGIFECESSYYFAKIAHIWGWASWADRWQQYDFTLKDYLEEKIKNFSDDKYIQKYWLNILRGMKNYEIDTWDYQWIFKVVENNGLCINPAKNLVSNIGFEGTHFSSNAKKDKNLNRPVYKIDKIIHPEKIEFNERAIDLLYKKAIGITKSRDLLIYMKRHPLFIFRKAFWNIVFK